MYFFCFRKMLVILLYFNSASKIISVPISLDLCLFVCLFHFKCIQHDSLLRNA